MKYHLTLINTDGFMLEETLDLPVQPEITWSDFESLAQVKNLMLLNPTMTLLDVTPDGMPDRFTDEQQLTRQLANMGIKKSVKANGASEYQDIVEEEE
jgi:hypothetical protein